MHSEINDVFPTSLSHVFGQKQAIDLIRVSIDACFYDHKIAFPTCIFLGPSGAGKSSLARLISYELATSFHEVLGQCVKNNAELNGLLLSAEEKSIVHIDEAHFLSKENQTALYLAIDKRVITVGAKTKAPQTLPLRNFSLILSTTEEYSLLEPLRNRALAIRLDYYSESDLMKIVAFRVKALGWDVHEKVIPLVAFRGKGVPRTALMLLASCRRVSLSLGEKTITEAHLNMACELENLDFLGLNHTERKYLRILAEGDTRLNVISSRLGLPSATISRVVEPFLLRAELVQKDASSSRVLTALGRGHLNELDSIENEGENGTGS